ncbi:NADH-quinone oxidoreductase subunit J family protein [Poriferisphaera sp. WC338]|uniref:NADH-quinone oxidoreductase subunit J family protein n=1 Tax=Poriferisphaera sp. WC338 TaxID=3425129 RepID=UPI003D8192EA
MLTNVAMTIQTPMVLYVASAISAVALYLMMPKRHLNWRLIGAIIGAATLGGAWFFLSRKLPWSELGVSNMAFLYYYVFSGIAIIAAVRVITHQRPIYSALWFIMVVLASAGLFIVLSAQFMAFAMIIIYGGAILVTYMFVIMLASSSGDAVNEDDIPEYDRIAREPLFAIAASFLFLAVILNVNFTPGDIPIESVAKGPSNHEIVTQYLSERNISAIEQAEIDRAPEGEKESVRTAIMASNVSNLEQVGLDLFRSHPLGLEIAGVILLISLIGAVVIAKTQVDEEDNLKQSA